MKDGGACGTVGKYTREDHQDARDGRYAQEMRDKTSMKMMIKDRPAGRLEKESKTALEEIPREAISSMQPGECTA
jgi:archaellum component FlaD/FlaE